MKSTFTRKPLDTETQGIKMLHVLLFCVCLCFVGLSGAGCQIPVLVQCFDSADCISGKSCQKGACINSSQKETAPASISCQTSHSHQYATPGTIVSMAFTTMLPIFATLDDKGWLAIWDKSTKQILSQTKLRTFSTRVERDRYQLAFHQTEPRLFVAQRDFSTQSLLVFDILSSPSKSKPYTLSSSLFTAGSQLSDWIWSLKQDPRFVIGIASGLTRASAEGTQTGAFLNYYKVEPLQDFRDIPSGKTVNVYSGKIWDASLSPDSKWLVTLGEDIANKKVLKLWSISISSDKPVFQLIKKQTLPKNPSCLWNGVSIGPLSKTVLIKRMQNHMCKTILTYDLASFVPHKLNLDDHNFAQDTSLASVGFIGQKGEILTTHSLFNRTVGMNTATMVRWVKNKEKVGDLFVPKHRYDVGEVAPSVSLVSLINRWYDNSTGDVFGWEYSTQKLFQFSGDTTAPKKQIVSSFGKQNGESIIHPTQPLLAYVPKIEERHQHKVNSMIELRSTTTGQVLSRLSFENGIQHNISKQWLPSSLLFLQSGKYLLWVWEYIDKVTPSSAVMFLFRLEQQKPGDPSSWRMKLVRKRETREASLAMGLNGAEWPKKARYLLLGRDLKSKMHLLSLDLTPDKDGIPKLELRKEGAYESLFKQESSSKHSGLKLMNLSSPEHMRLGIVQVRSSKQNQQKLQWRQDIHQPRWSDTGKLSLVPITQTAWLPFPYPFFASAHHAGRSWGAIMQRKLSLFDWGQPIPKATELPLDTAINSAEVTSSEITFHSSGNFIAHQVTDSQSLSRVILWKANEKKALQQLPAGFATPGVKYPTKIRFQQTSVPGTSRLLLRTSFGTQTWSCKESK